VIGTGRRRHVNLAGLRVNRLVYGSGRGEPRCSRSWHAGSTCGAPRSPAPASPRLCGPRRLRWRSPRRTCCG